jgi:short-subunit dehydrogenase
MAAGGSVKVKADASAAISTARAQKLRDGPTLKTLLSAAPRNASMIPPSRQPLALVTGATGEVGRELVRQFASKGYDLILVAPDAERLTAIAGGLRAMQPSLQVVCIAAEISTYEGVEALYRAVVSLGRALTVLVANAEGERSARGARNARLDAELALINLNVTALVHVIERLVGNVVIHGTGKVLILSSVAASAALDPCHAVRAASKAFLRSFGHALRGELQEAGIAVTVMIPGPVDAAEIALSACQALDDDEQMIPALLTQLALGAEQHAD